MTNFNAEQKKSYQYMVDLIKHEMHYFSQVHFVNTCNHSIQFYCEYITFDCSCFSDIKQKLSLVEIEISDGLLTFDLRHYFQK